MIYRHILMCGGLLRGALGECDGQGDVDSEVLRSQERGFHSVSSLGATSGRLFSRRGCLVLREIHALDESGLRRARSQKCRILGLPFVRTSLERFISSPEISSGSRRRIIPCYLPPYSPDFNPIEQVWGVIKGRFFTNWVANTPDRLVERICEALRFLLRDNIPSIASTKNLS